jgi:hypothetical protein
MLNDQNEIKVPVSIHPPRDNNLTTDVFDLVYANESQRDKGHYEFSSTQPVCNQAFFELLDSK